MKTKLFFTMCLITALHFMLHGQENTSTITIKTYKIINGDTILAEKTFNNGNGVFYNDSIFEKDFGFIFFNKEYSLDTNFEDDFNEMFSKEMQLFMKDFNKSFSEDVLKSNDLFNQSFTLDFDSLKNDFFIFYSDSLNPNEYQIRIKPSEQAGNIQKKIITTHLPEASKGYIPLFSINEYSAEYFINICFGMDPKQGSQIIFSKEKKLYKEKVPSSKGIYNRRFDFSPYKEGIYYLKVKQGKNCITYRIEIK